MSGEHNLRMTHEALHSRTIETGRRVPANKIGFHQAAISVAQLKIIQEVVTLSVSVPFAVFYQRERVRT